MASSPPEAGAPPAPIAARGARVSDELGRWLSNDEDTSLGALADFFGPKSFALLFVLLLSVPALPLPTGGATHVFELIAVLLALELLVGRDEIWLPRRWRALDLAGPRKQKFLRTLLRLVARLERISKPRFAFLFRRRVSRVLFGALVVGGCVAAFVAPPFTGLDTLPALGVVLISLGFLLEDILVVLLGIAAGAAGVALELVVGAAALHGFHSLF